MGGAGISRARARGVSVSTGLLVIVRSARLSFGLPGCAQPEAQKSWVAVEELSLSYRNMDTLKKKVSGLW